MTLNLTNMEDVFSHFLLWLFHLFQFTNGCKDIVIKPAIEGQALVNHTFLSTHATNDAHCQTMCFLDDRCVSFNFGRCVSGESYTCELNEADHRQFPDDLVPRPGTIYRMVETTCNCSKNEICRPDFEMQTHRCICKTGYMLEHCASFEVKNCHNYTKRNGIYELDGTGSQAMETVCRGILNANGDSDSLQTQPYRITVDLYSGRPDGQDVTHPGIGFNVLDEDNFGFVMIRTHWKTQWIMAGNVKKGRKTDFSSPTTVSTPPAYAWFQLGLEVQDQFAKVFIDGNFAGKFASSFPLRQRGAVVTINGYNTFVRFRNFTITSL